MFTKYCRSHKFDSIADFFKQVGMIFNKNNTEHDSHDGNEGDKSDDSSDEYVDDDVYGEYD